jgi:hypothetical protein
VFGQAASGYFAKQTTNRTVGSLDDCGRFAIKDLSNSLTSIVVVFHNPPYVETATFVPGLTGTVGTTTGISAYTVATADATKWGQEIAGAGSAPSIVGGYIVEFEGAATPATIRINGTPIGTEPTAPWGAYFAGSAAFGDLDPALTATAPNASAFVMPTTGSTFTLGASRTGKTCSQMSLQQVNGVLMAITIPSC